METAEARTNKLFSYAEMFPLNNLLGPKGCIIMFALAGLNQQQPCQGTLGCSKALIAIVIVPMSC